MFGHICGHSLQGLEPIKHMMINLMAATYTDTAQKRPPLHEDREVLEALDNEVEAKKTSISLMHKLLPGPDIRVFFPAATLPLDLEHDASKPKCLCSSS